MWRPLSEYYSVYWAGRYALALFLLLLIHSLPANFLHILARYANPVFGNGDYPEVMKKQYLKLAHSAQLEKSPLPEFTQEEIALNKGTLSYNDNINII